MDKIILKNPIEINGKQVTELSYDIDKIGVEQFYEADLYKNKAIAAKGSTSLAMEMDYTMQLYLGFAAITAVNPQYDVHDLERIKGVDIRKVVVIGRNFTNGVEEDGETQTELPAKNSAKSPEPTAEPTTQA